MMQRLVAKGIVRSYSMSKKRRNKPVAICIISECDVCGGFMFNAKRLKAVGNGGVTRATVDNALL